LTFFFLGLVVRSDVRVEEYHIDYDPEGKPVISNKKPPPKSKIIRQREFATVSQAQDPSKAKPKVQSEDSRKPFTSE
jgi:hypothetical protein